MTKQTPTWQQKIDVVRVTMLKWGIDNEIQSRQADDNHQPLFRIAGETIRQCLILIEDSLAEVPGYTNEIHDHP